MAQDLKSFGITISTVLPGATATPLRARSVPHEDPSTILPEEVAEAICFLATRPPDVIIPELAIFSRVAL